VGRQYKKVNRVVHIEGYERRSDVAAMTVHNKQPSLGLGRPCLRLERPLHPLKCVTIGRPATIACGKAPVIQDISWNPASVGVLRLKDQYGR
jgi:hypothetical protein